MVELKQIQTACRFAAGAVAALAVLTQPMLAQQPAGQPPPAQGQSLPLTMEQAVTMGLESNLGLKATRLDLDIASHAIAGARAAFRPLLFSRFGRSTSESQPQSFTEGGASVITSRGMSVGNTLSQALPWLGGQFDVTWSANRNETSGAFSSFNPRLGSSLTVNFLQPLWRDLRIDPNRAAVETSERRRVITDMQLQQTVVRTETDIRQAYLSLVAAIEARKVSQQNMDIAQQTLKNARARVEVGQAPQIDIIQAEAEVARNQEQLIFAAARISFAEDDLRSLILNPDRPDYWDVRIEPTDTIELKPREIDVAAAIKNALANRLDVAVLRRDLEIRALTIRVTDNSTKPTVDFGVTYIAQGTGGTQLQFGEGFPPPIVSRTDRSFGSVLSDTFGGAYPSWTVGLQFSYPIGHSAAEAALAQQRLEKQKVEIGLRDLELQVVKEVREAARAVMNSYERVLATRTALTASQQQLEAEERRFAVGLSTTLELQLRQRDLASARNAELGARIDYNRALITFERVQKTR